jgi:hypothetical protein
MGRMTTEATYDRPVPATMIVRLANGEEFEAKAEDFAKFGYVDKDRVMADWRAFIEDATGADLLTLGSELNPLRVALFCALNNPAALTEDSMEETRKQISTMARAVRVFKAEQDF